MVVNLMTRRVQGARQGTRLVPYCEEAIENRVSGVGGRIIPIEGPAEAGQRDVLGNIQKCMHCKTLELEDIHK